MKKFSLMILLISLLFIGTCLANEIDRPYKEEILNNHFLYNTSGFFEAIKKDNVYVVKLFLQAGMNPNATLFGTPATMYALFLNRIEILDILLSAGGDVETSVPALWVAYKPQNLLSYAIKRKNLSAVEILIKHGVDINKKFNNVYPINYAVKTDQQEIVLILLKAGAISRGPSNNYIEE